MLTVATHERNDRTYVELEGRLDGSPSCAELSREVKARIDEGHLDFVVDLGHVEWMSSSGIGCLISTYASVRRAGGSMALRSPNDRVLAALRVTDLVPSVFEVIGEESPDRKLAD